jgi:spore coat polysaccharide biosynthesis protein SpsF
MILGAVQVRLGSTRLLGKALLEILGRPMLYYPVERLGYSGLIDKTVISTSIKDREIIDFAIDNGIEYYAGSELDLVDRLYQTAKKFKADALVRITGDCPLIDPRVVDKVIQCYLDNKDKVDYVSNVHPPTYPDGLDTDVYPTKTLEVMHNEITDSGASIGRVKSFIWGMYLIY